MAPMAIELTGGCRVTGLREGPATEQGTLRARQHFGRAQGAAAISLRVLELGPGRSPRLGAAACDEVVYVLEGSGTVRFDGSSRPLAPDTAFYVPPGAWFEIDAPGPLLLVSSRCPDPEGTAQAPAPEFAPVVVRLEDCASELTGDRWYRVLLDHHLGQSRVTQFVGAIPPGRAPDHYHEYEEVLCILGGRGRMWAGDRSTSIERGSCIYLPRRQVHCVENTGDSELRLLGVFHPSGSPAVRYPATPR
jgi:mannose-6-phosphate isomerase-like protein (cupin superfamily)